MWNSGYSLTARAVFIVKVSRCRNSLNIPSIHSLLSYEDDGEFDDDDDEGDSDSYDLLDDSDKDSYSIFDGGYSESMDSSVWAMG